ncbi:protein of unknown function [Agrobacterium pusense]|uniref:Uncharacterized protein n=1 Tax=Agrobacterium pusense TaxID=648995 RepID=U4Q1V0_9HYPH|nr:protein of unknown function [Agrobacterium pusense]
MRRITWGFRIRAPTRALSLYRFDTRHPGHDPGSSAIKSLIAKDSLSTAQTRRGWIPAQGRNDGGEVLRLFQISPSS